MTGAAGVEDIAPNDVHEPSVRLAIELRALATRCSTSAYAMAVTVPPPCHVTC